MRGAWEMARRWRLLVRVSHDGGYPGGWLRRCARGTVSGCPYLQQAPPELSRSRAAAETFVAVPASALVCVVVRRWSGRSRAAQLLGASAGSAARSRRGPGRAGWLALRAAQTAAAPRRRLQRDRGAIALNQAPAAEPALPGRQRSPPWGVATGGSLGVNISPPSPRSRRDHAQPSPRRGTGFAGPPAEPPRGVATGGRLGVNIQQKTGPEGPA